MGLSVVLALDFAPPNNDGRESVLAALGLGVATSSPTFSDCCVGTVATEGFVILKTVAVCASLRAFSQSMRYP